MYQQIRPTNLHKSHKQQSDIQTGIDPMVGTEFACGLIARWSMSEGLLKDTQSVHILKDGRR